MEPTAKPCLKITGLHVEGLKALRRVDWPADGMGWGGQVPDMVMVGGINGSGKTTLLELIAAATNDLCTEERSKSWNDSTMNAWIDIRVVVGPLEEPSDTTPLDLPVLKIAPSTFRIIVGDRIFVEANAKRPGREYTHGGFEPLGQNVDGVWVPATFHTPLIHAGSACPRVVYFPTDRRLEIPDESFKAAGDIEDTEGFYYRFRAAENWSESLGALLYGARWADLNAKEEGHPERATHFESYSRAFQAFFGESKALVWEGGKLFVKIKDTGALHPLMELSSGEKQALILAAELYRRWRPGSLILIDEPELHFHSSWQTRLWLMLAKWQKERGGQVIVTTQSTHLFGVAEPGTTVLLGKGLV